MEWMISGAKGRTSGKWKKRKAPIKGMIAHTTGAGLYNRWKRDNPEQPTSIIDYTEQGAAKWGFLAWRKRKGKEATPFDTALRVYGSLMNAGPHFVVCGETGRVAQLCELDRAAWHVGSRYSGKYKWNRWKKKCAWWQDRWPEYDSPREMMDGLLWTHYGCNDLTVGIEVAPPPKGAQKPWSAACMRSLQDIYRHVCFYASEEVDVLSHADVHPYSRTSNNKPTDPARTQWTRKVANAIKSNL